MAHALKVYKIRKGEPTKDFTWRCRYKRPDGEWGSRSDFPTKVTALAWGRKQEADIKAGRWVDPELTDTPFGEFAREWMTVKVKRGRTVSKRWDLLETHILPEWEHTTLGAINWFDVDSWQLTLSCDDVTAGHSVTLMSMILTGAVDKKHIPVNPLFGRRRTARVVTAAAKPKKTDEEKWAPPEVVLRVAQRLGPVNGLHVLATAFTGLNWGEGLALRPEQLRSRRQAHDGGWFECPALWLENEVAEYTLRDQDGTKRGTVLQLEPLKTDRRKRGVDLPPFLATLIRYHIADHPEREWLFCTPSGSWWRRGNWGTKVMRPACDGREERKKRRGVAYRPAWEPIMKGLTMRDLRHSHDTFQDQIGVRPSLMFEQAGHKRPGIKSVYQHPTPEMRQERLDGLQLIYERAMGNLGWKTLWDRVDLRRPPQS